MSTGQWATTVWNLSHGHETFADFLAHVGEVDHDNLVRIAANTLLNDWCSDVADWSDHESETFGEGGKRLPYIGWYWRSIDFAGGYIPIGDCGEFVGFMANNKWDHDERDLTPAEAEQVVGLLWTARAEASKGGNVAQLNANRDRVLSDLWDLMQTFDVREAVSA